MSATGIQLTPRQQEILRRVVEEYVSTGQPVGSRTLVQTGGVTAAPSTVRAELAELESRGLLTHPHTSAGRVPTESGYRYYADELLGRLDAQPAEFPLDLHTTRTEVESALQATTEMLSQVTRLLALVSAPPLEATTIVRTEVLLLQPELVMVVVITSAGGVTKPLFHFVDAVDPGLAQWANEYLNETVSGLQLGTTLLRRRFDDPGLSVRERAFLAALFPAFTELVSAAQRLYVGGAADLLGDVRAEELDAYRNLFDLVEKRAALLDVLGDSPAEPRRPFVRVGAELVHPALREVALVGAYEVLSKSETRELYDRYGHAGLRSGGFQPGHFDFGSLSDLFSAFFGDDLLGGRGGRGRGADLVSAVEIELVEAARGLTREVPFEVAVQCAHCDGDGAEPGTEVTTCPTCGGAGRLQHVTRSVFGEFVRTQACPDCAGSGRRIETPCSECHGGGRVVEERTLTVEIPAGIHDGQRIRLG